MNNLWTRTTAIVLIIVTQWIVLPTLPLASSAPNRGQFPECQEECLKQHTEEMHRVAEKYKKTNESLQYQDDVQNLGLQYEACLDNCRQLYPVK